jgi:spore germination protein
MDKRRGILFLVVLSLCLSGCTDTRQLERLAFIHTIAYDLKQKTENGKEADYLEVTDTIPIADPETKKARELLSAVVKTSKEAKIELSRKTNRILVDGQVRNCIFGLSLAKQGLWKYIDTLRRDPSVGQRLFIAVVDGNAHDLLIKNYHQHPITGHYIYRLLEKEGRIQTIPMTSLYTFTRDYFDDGIDPVAPIIKQEKNNVRVNGIALFHQDRYVTKIPLKKGTLFALLRGNLRQGEISIAVKRGKKTERVMYISILSKHHVKVKRLANSHQYEVDLNLKIQGSVLEYTGSLDITKEKERKKLELLMSNGVKKDLDQLASFMQKNGVDSLGLGSYVRNSLSYKEWKALNWGKIYPNIKVVNQVDLKIKDVGKSK